MPTETVLYGAPNTKCISDHFPSVQLKKYAFLFGWADVTEHDNPESSYDNFHSTFNNLYTFFQPKIMS